MQVKTKISETAGKLRDKISFVGDYTPSLYSIPVSYNMVMNRLRASLSAAQHETVDFRIEDFEELDFSHSGQGSDGFAICDQKLIKS